MVTVYRYIWCICGIIGRESPKVWSYTVYVIVLANPRRPLYTYMVYIRYIWHGNH
jgi:hypothetical protein